MADELEPTGSGAESSDHERTSLDEWLALDELESLLWISVGIGLLALIASSTKGALAVVGIGALIFLGSFMAGAFLGFLFGVPRVLSKDEEPATGGPPQGANAGNPPLAPPPATAKANTARRLLKSNTNLERISDWLTTMIVGATLVELHKLNDALIGFRDFLAQTATVTTAADGSPSAGVLPGAGPVILVFGGASGFLFMYLSSRLVLVRMFHAVELLISGEGKLERSAQRVVRAFARRQALQGSFVDGQIGSKSKVTTEDALSLMLDLLYKNDPDKVLALGAQLADSAATNRAEYWFYLAAAFGQKLRELDVGSDEWRSARDNALDCARRAVSLNPNFRLRLWLISDPNSYDNDLAPLRDDPEFLRIVGRDPSR